MSRKYQHRRDSNHTVIVDGLEAIGWGWLDASQSGLSIDGFAVKQGRIVPLEIKDGSLPPSARKLSPKEAKRHAWFQRFGIKVLTIFSLSDLQQLDRDARKRFEER